MLAEVAFLAGTSDEAARAALAAAGPAPARGSGPAAAAPADALAFLQVGAPDAAPPGVPEDTSGLYCGSGLGSGSVFPGRTAPPASECTASMAAQAVREAALLDAGLNCRGAYPTDPSAAAALGRWCRERPLRISLHGTPRQWGAHPP